MIDRSGFFNTYILVCDIAFLSNDERSQLYAIAPFITLRRSFIINVKRNPWYDDVTDQ